VERIAFGLDKIVIEFMALLEICQPEQSRRLNHKVHRETQRNIALSDELSWSDDGRHKIKLQINVA